MINNPLPVGTKRATFVNAPAGPGLPYLAPVASEGPGGEAMCFIAFSLMMFTRCYAQTCRGRCTEMLIFVLRPAATAQRLPAPHLGKIFSGAFRRNKDEIS